MGLGAGPSVRWVGVWDVRVEVGRVAGRGRWRVVRACDGFVWGARVRVWCIALRKYYDKTYGKLWFHFMLTENIGKQNPWAKSPDHKS